MWSSTSLHCGAFFRSVLHSALNTSITTFFAFMFLFNIYFFSHQFPRHRMLKVYQRKILSAAGRFRFPGDERSVSLCVPNNSSYEDLNLKKIGHDIWSHFCSLSSKRSKSNAFLTPKVFQDVFFLTLWCDEMYDSYPRGKVKIKQFGHQQFKYSLSLHAVD